MQRFDITLTTLSQQNQFLPFCRMKELGASNGEELVPIGE
jgi:hypothetical protein